MFSYQTSHAGIKNKLYTRLGQIQISLKADIVVLYTIDQVSKQPVLAMIVGQNNSNAIKDNTQSWKGLVWRVIQKRDVVTINNIWLEQFSLVRRNFFLREKIISYTGFPISTNGKLLGILEVFFRQKHQPDQTWYSKFREVVQDLIPLINER